MRGPSARLRDLAARAAFFATAAVAAMLVSAAHGAPATPAPTAPAIPAPPAVFSAPQALAPPYSFRFRFENVEGAILLDARLRSRSGADTSGVLVLDTGAGFLGLDGELLRRLGLADSTITPMTFAPNPLPRMTIGELQQDLVGPVLAIETKVIHQATDRQVFGLLGQNPLDSFAVRIDYRVDSLALIPVPRDGLVATPARRPMAAELAAGQAAFLMATRASRQAMADFLAPDAVSLPFELAGDGKILVVGRCSDDATGTQPALNFVLDTGATKTVLFAGAMERSGGRGTWSELHGLSAPTLYGSEDAYLTRVPALSLGRGAQRATARDVDAAVMGGALEATLGRAVGRPVDGLIGYSFLRRFRVTIDYPHRVLWLEPLAVPRDQRPYEYSHIGLQVERHDNLLRIVAVAEKSPAADAGLRAGDEVIWVDEIPAARLDVVSLSRKLEGPPGTTVRIRVRQGEEERTFRMTRRRLL